MEKAKLDSLLIAPVITIKEAMKRLNETAEKILFAVDGRERLIGTVTDGDIRRGLIQGLKFSDKVKKIMNVNFIKVFYDDTEKIEKAKRAMREKEIGQIPVLDKKGRVVDLVIWTDIVEASTARNRNNFFSNPVVIMAGGRGRRLEPFTRILPKSLIPINEKPIIEIIMEKFYHRGFRNFIFTLNYKKEYIKTFLKENNFPYRIDWVEEDDYTGTAGSISLLGGKIRETFIVSNCDIVLDADYADILKWHKEHNNIMTLIGCHKEIQIPYGILEMNNGVLKHFIEKPNYDLLINTGLYVVEPQVIKLIPKNKNIDINHIIASASRKGRVSVYPLNNGSWFDMGQWEEYNKSLQELSDIQRKCY